MVEIGRVHETTEETGREVEGREKKGKKKEKNVREDKGGKRRHWPVERAEKSELGEAKAQQVSASL